MSHDSVRVDPDAASAALRAWQAAVEEAHRLVQVRTAAMGDAEAARPWGSDNGGPQFAEVYRAGAQPSRDGVRVLTGQLQQLGCNVGTAIEASLDSDAQQAAALTPAWAELEGLPVRS